MANELKKLVREAFNIAYTNHKTNKINESVEGLKSKMSSGDIYKVENVFRSIVANPNLAIKYAWTPQGSANGELNTNQFNLLVEMVYEKTDMAAKKNLIMSFYNQENKALFNKAAKRIMSSLGVATNQQTLESAYMEGWAQMFLETQSKKTGERKQNFEDITALYSGKKFIDSKGNERESNFGAYIAEIITSNILNAYKDEMSRGGRATSLDEPSSTTGKPADFGTEDDFGSDTQHATMGAEDLGNLGAGLDNPETIGEPEDIEVGAENQEDGDDYESLAGDEDSGVENGGGETIGSGIEAVDSEEDRKEKEEDKEDRKEKDRKDAKRNITALYKALFHTIKEYEEYHEPTQAQKNGLTAIKAFISGLEPKEATKKLGFNATTAFENLKDSKEFTRIANDYFLADGVLGARGRAMSFSDLQPKYIAWSAQFFKSKNDKQFFKSKVADQKFDLDDRGRSASKIISPEELKRRKEAFSQEFTENQSEKIKQTIILKSSLKNAITQFEKTVQVTPEQEQGLKALSDLLKYNTNTTEISAKVGYDAHSAIDNLLHDKKFAKIADDIVRSKSKVKVGSVANLDADDLSKVIVDLRTGGSSSLAEMSLNEFIDKNMDKIMERVYKRLAPKLNS